jgi:hypothetical protein
MLKEPERNPRKVLGKGLSALLPTRSAPVPDTQPQSAATVAKAGLPENFEEFNNIPLDQLHPGEEQPRDVFDTASTAFFSRSSSIVTAKIATVSSPANAAGALPV